MFDLIQKDAFGFIVFKDSNIAKVAKCKKIKIANIRFPVVMTCPEKTLANHPEATRSSPELILRLKLNLGIKGIQIQENNTFLEKLHA